MPVTSVGYAPVAAPARPPTSAAAPAPAAPAAASAPTGAGAVGHGVTRLKAYTRPTPFIPGQPPPRGETAGAHGAHKGRISIIH
jgi:hypothetical protein